MTTSGHLKWASTRMKHICFQRSRDVDVAKDGQEIPRGGTGLPAGYVDDGNRVRSRESINQSCVQGT